MTRAETGHYNGKFTVIKQHVFILVSSGNLLLLVQVTNQMPFSQGKLGYALFAFVGGFMIISSSYLFFFLFSVGARGFACNRKEKEEG